MSQFNCVYGDYDVSRVRKMSVILILMIARIFLEFYECTFSSDSHEVMEVISLIRCHIPDMA